MYAVEGINGFQPQAWGFASALATPSQGGGYLHSLYMQYRNCQGEDAEKRKNSERFFTNCEKWHKKRHKNVKRGVILFCKNVKIIDK